MSTTPADVAEAREPREPTDAAKDAELESLHVQTVLDAWRRWQGSFIDFCEHVQRKLLVPFGRDLVRRILEVNGQRSSARRQGRGPDELALRGAFRTFFAGAQWVGDGMQVPVFVDAQRFVFNLELDVDAHTAALVGVSVRDEEDGAAVIEAFDHGVLTTGAPPLALLLDNKPSNHTPGVDDAIGDTLRIRATPERPQNKAIVAQPVPEHRNSSSARADESLPRFPCRLPSAKTFDHLRVTLGKSRVSAGMRFWEIGRRVSRRSCKCLELLLLSKKDVVNRQTPTITSMLRSQPIDLAHCAHWPILALARAEHYVMSGRITASHVTEAMPAFK